MNNLFLTILLTFFAIACSSSDSSPTEPEKKILPINAPTNVQIVTASSTSIGIKWDDNSTNESKFVIELKSGNSDWTSAGEAAVNKTEYLATSLTEGNKYIFRVKAVNNEAESEYSDEATVYALTQNHPFNPDLLQPKSYKLAMFQRNVEIGEATIDIKIENGQFKFTETLSAPSVNFYEVNETYMNQNTYVVEKFDQFIALNNDTTIFNSIWSANQIEVEQTSSNGKLNYVKSIQNNSVEGNSFFHMLNSLPLKLNFERQIYLYNSQSNKLLDVKLLVEEEVSKTVPAGTFDTYKILLKGIDPDVYVFIDKATMKLVKTETPTTGIEYRLK